MCIFASITQNDNMQNSSILRYLFCLVMVFMSMMSLAGPANSSEDTMTVKKAESIITSTVIQSSSLGIYFDALTKLKTGEVGRGNATIYLTDFDWFCLNSTQP